MKFLLQRSDKLQVCYYLKLGICPKFTHIPRMLCDVKLQLIRDGCKNPLSSIMWLSINRTVNYIHIYLCMLNINFSFMYKSKKEGSLVKQFFSQITKDTSTISRTFTYQMKKWKRKLFTLFLTCYCIL